MTFDYPGYTLKFVQKDGCKDHSAHICSYIYKFFSPVTRYFYITRAEYHEGDVFAIKFYCKKDRGSQFKYSKIVNKGDLGNIIMSCAKVIPMLLHAHPHVSFAFAASRSIEYYSQTIEDPVRTQRYRLYCYMIPLKFGFETFDHYQYDSISSYLLLNRRTQSSKKAIEGMFSATYQDI